MGMVLISIQRFLKESLTDNLGLKLVAAIIAALLWLVVTYQEEAVRHFDVAVQVSQAPKNLVLSNELPDTVKVQVRGPKGIIEGIKESQILPVTIDLDRVRKGVSHYYLGKDAFDEAFDSATRPGLELVRFAPESLTVRMEKLISRRLPVRIRTYGKLKKGTELADEPQITPTTVVVNGASSALRGVSAVETEDVDIDGHEPGEHVHVVPLKPMDGVTIRHNSEIQVGLKVRWVPGQRMISGLLLQARGTELSAEFRPKEVAVALSGPQVMLDKLDPSKVVPAVVLDETLGRRIGTHQGTVTVEGLPDDISVTSVVPKKVQVKLTTTGAMKPKKAPAAP